MQNRAMVTYERIMIPLVLAWALSIDKSQGQTLPLAVLGVGEVERQLGLLFVAISRVRRSEDFALVRAVPLSRLLGVNNHSSRARRDAKMEALAALEAPYLRWLVERLGREDVIQALREWLSALCEEHNLLGQGPVSPGEKLRK